MSLKALVSEKDGAGSGVALKSGVQGVVEAGGGNADGI